MFINKKSRSFRFSLVCGMVLSLVFAAGSLAAAQTTIKMWFLSSFYTSDSIRAFYDNFLEEFNKANPDIKLEYRIVAGGLAGLNEAVAVGVATGTGPDIAYISSNTVARLTHGQLHAGLARPLDEYIDRWDGKKDILPALLDEVRIDGKTYALPFIMWPNMDIYNYDLFDANGVAVPNTWDEQIAATRRLTRIGNDGKVEIWGYRAPMNDFFAFYLLGRAMEQLGTKLIEPEAKSGSINNDIGRQAMNYLHELYRVGMPDGRVGVTANDVMGNKVAAFQAQSTSTVVIGLEDTDIRYGFHRFTKPAGGTDILQVMSGTLYMLSTTQHPDKAWRVMEAFLKPNNLKKYYMVEPRWQPVHRSLFADPEIISRPQSLATLQLMIDPITSYGPSHPLLTEISTPVGAYLRPAIMGQTSISSALEEAERVMNNLIAELMK